MLNITLSPRNQNSEAFFSLHPSFHFNHVINFWLCAKVIIYWVESVNLSNLNEFLGDLRMLLFYFLICLMLMLSPPNGVAWVFQYFGLNNNANNKTSFGLKK